MVRKKDQYAHLRTPEVRKKAALARAKTFRAKKKAAKNRVNLDASLLGAALNSTKQTFVKKKQAAGQPVPMQMVVRLIMAVADYCEAHGRR